LEFDPDPVKAIAGSLMMLCTRAAVVGEGECDAVEIGSGVGDAVTTRSVAFPVTGCAPLLDRD
jgi:hypothetical protein